MEQECIDGIPVILILVVFVMINVKGWVFMNGVREDIIKGNGVEIG